MIFFFNKPLERLTKTNVSFNITNTILSTRDTIQTQLNRLKNKPFLKTLVNCFVSEYPRIKDPLVPRRVQSIPLCARSTVNKQQLLVGNCKTILPRYAYGDGIRKIDLCAQKILKQPNYALKHTYQLRGMAQYPTESSSSTLPTKAAQTRFPFQSSLRLLTWPSSDCNTAVKVKSYLRSNVS